MRKGRRYTDNEKRLIEIVAKDTKNRYEMEHIVAPYLAQLLGRSVCAICKQIELVIGKHWREVF